MITRRARVQIALFVVLSLAGALFVGFKYLGIGDGSYQVYVDMADTGGAYEHGSVTYRGVQIGRVGEINLRPGGARVQLDIDRGVQVPRDLKVVVANRSAVGEQYVDLRPASDAAPYLEPGETIGSDKVTVPLAVESLLTNLDALVATVDPEDLGVVIDELGQAFEGNGEALATILDATDALLTDAAAYLPETLTLLKDGRTVLDTQADSAQAIARWAKGLREFTETLKKSDGDLRTILAAAPETTTQVSDLIRDLDPQLGVLLGNMISVNGVAVRRLPGIESLLISYPSVVSGSFTVTPGDGTAHFGLVLNFDNPPPCIYNKGAGPVTCTGGELGDGSAVRGWQNAPGPTGGPIYPAPLPGEPEPDPAAEPAPTSLPGTTIAGYDPATGLVVDNLGLPIAFGGTGGQYALAGDQSWRQLLLAGLAA
ncbi:MCE family protein [Phytomonospora endophytica]|uniref:Phospholipid/cholesterol/gamma-HCH transport system substrate-binding protein n=1 Tax=Phytomonospora endophytica TaxID=714109 RepID=A0A841FN11_9ACTN|nr:MlaD family protein [Phytomonospora endophytica]MBB6037415.1 phospholipid/cholesterol/gamma-HCH transport system substrate-binding protein [Phytomonospora endophytica]GIG69842.1 ABC transporter substrate-binding protein [Phytomonospora endophytica]